MSQIVTISLTSQLKFYKNEIYIFFAIFCVAAKVVEFASAVPLRLIHFQLTSLSRDLPFSIWFTLFVDSILPQTKSVSLNCSFENLAIRLFESIINNYFFHVLASDVAHSVSWQIHRQHESLQIIFEHEISSMLSCLSHLLAAEMSAQMA